MILAIDFGSTSIKAAVFDRRLRPVHQTSVPLTYRYGAGGRVELPVAGVERAVHHILSQTKDLAAIAVTSQAQTFTVLDRRGRATRPFVSWLDGSAQPAFAALRRPLRDCAEQGSFELLPVLQVCQLKHRPVAAGETVVNLPSYFVRQWTGANVLDDNLAAMTGLYSLPRGDWWPAALRACGIRPSQLPRVVPVGTIGAVTKAGVPVVLAGNDQTAGAYGARLEEDHRLLLTLGTAQVAYVCFDRLPPPRTGTARGAYPGGRGYRLTANSAGGTIINWAKTILADCATDAAFFRRAASAPPGCNGLVFDLSESGDSATWRNITMHHTEAEFARAVVEGLSRQMATLVRRLGVRLPEREVLVAGGGSEDRLWVATVAKELGVRLRVTMARPVLGAARMAVECLND